MITLMIFLININNPFAILFHYLFKQECLFQPFHLRFLIMIHIVLKDFQPILFKLNVIILVLILMNASIKQELSRSEERRVGKERSSSCAGAHGGRTRTNGL